MVHRERALENLTVGSGGLVFSQSLLLALVESGVPRDDAYRAVQRCARTAAEEGRDLREVVEPTQGIGLDDAALDRAFDPARLLAQRGRFLDALTWRQP